MTLVQGNIEKGEVRKSITISVMVMFYGLVAIHCHDVLDKNSLIGLVLDKFWAIVVAVTGYYFATRAYEMRRMGVDLQSIGTSRITTCLFLASSWPGGSAGTIFSESWIPMRDESRSGLAIYGRLATVLRLPKFGSTTY